MKIAILLYEGFTALDAIGPYEVLSRLPEATVHFVAEHSGPQRTDTHSLALIAETPLSALPNPDIFVIPGGMVGTFAAAENPAIRAWVKTAHQTSRWTMSVCTGALILGAAGLLKDLKATTHWFAKDYLAKYGAEYLPERFVRQGKIITAAGVSAGIDAALYLAGEVAGAEIAQAIQLGIEYDPQPPFDTGSLPKASARLSTLALSLLVKESARAKGQ
jgi:putative intracellular protease/amidase